MLVGIGFIALLTAFVADRFIRQDVGEDAVRYEDQVLAKLDANRYKPGTENRAPTRGSRGA